MKADEVANLKIMAVRDKFVELFSDYTKGGMPPVQNFTQIARFAYWLRIVGADLNKALELAHGILVSDGEKDSVLLDIRTKAAAEATTWYEGVNSKAQAALDEFNRQNAKAAEVRLLEQLKKEKESAITIKMLADRYSDWEYVFAYGKPDTAPGEEKTVSDKAFGREDVKVIHGYANGENDGDPWIMWGMLKDGRFFFIDAWCDYTGWGCQEGGRSYVSATEHGIKKCMTFEDGARMGARQHITE